jgi:hypothetical protein
VPLNVNTAVQIDSVLSASARGAHASRTRAINTVRNALSNAQPASTEGAQARAAFDTARQMAAERFGLHRAIPALEAAANGTVPADDFVKKFVLNAEVKELRALPICSRENRRKRTTGALTDRSRASAGWLRRKHLRR